MIYEHRIYTVIPGKTEEEISRITDWFPIIEKCGAKVVAGIFQTVIGDSNELSYIIGYDDLAHRQRVFESMAEDDDMKKLAGEWAKGEPLNYNTRNKILRSTEYSPSK